MEDTISDVDTAAPGFTCEGIVPRKGGLARKFGKPVTKSCGKVATVAVEREFDGYRWWTTYCADCSSF